MMKRGGPDKLVEISKIQKSIYDTLDVLFPSNHNIHKSSCGLYFWASDPLIERF